jgi:hypothetical protein
MLVEKVEMPFFPINGINEKTIRVSQII